MNGKNSIPDISENNITEIFKLLNNWRGFPAYQLERRADIFFAYYLPQIFTMDGLSNTAITHDQIIPEFPLKIDEISNRSNKVDYAVFCKDMLYLVELKTNMDHIKSSYKQVGDHKQEQNQNQNLIKGQPSNQNPPKKLNQYEKQKEYLQNAASKSLTELISDLIELQCSVRVKQHREKYKKLTVSLFKILKNLYGVDIPDCALCMNCICRAEWKDYRVLIKSIYNNLNTKKLSIKPAIIYIQPKLCKESAVPILNTPPSIVYTKPKKCENSEDITRNSEKPVGIITFDSIIKHLSSYESLKDDTLAKQFCQSLHTWSK